MALRLRNYHLARIGLVALRSGSKLSASRNGNENRRAHSNGSKCSNSNTMDDRNLYRRMLNILRSPKRQESTGWVQLGAKEFEPIAEETLIAIGDVFEEDVALKIEDIDIRLSDGVLTADLGQHGIYVINKQSPNRQIWLSSPKSGPKRYDFTGSNWVYKHDLVALHDLLSKELTEICQTEIDFTRCMYGSKLNGPKSNSKSSQIEEQSIKR